MSDIDLSERALAELELADGAVAIEPITGRWELLVSATAAVSAIVVMGAVLLTLTAELRAGWIPGHELPMDKATAIHKLLFRA